MRKLKLLTLILLLGTAVAAAAPRPESPVDRTYKDMTNAEKGFLVYHMINTLSVH